MSPAQSSAPDQADARRFTAPMRHLLDEDRIVLTSVGVDIGSSTSHLLFSRLELQREDSRYVIAVRVVLHASEILLTPYTDRQTIDGQALGAFVERQYRAAGLRRDQVDSGALILTGVALLRQNARAIAELFAEEAGRFVAVSAGDSLESIMAAHGSGAVALSERGALGVMNVDVGGGTTKVAVCRDGRVGEVVTLDVGARLVAWDERGIVTRLEPAGRRIGQALGLELAIGARLTERDRAQMAASMAEQLVGAIRVGGTVGHTGESLLRGAPLRDRAGIGAITFSGGVAEFIYGRQADRFGDLGPLLAAAIRARARKLGTPIREAAAGIRATVIGASQYTVQLSGSTIYLAPLEVVPVRNVPVVTPSFPWDADPFDVSAVRGAVHEALRRFDLLEPRGPVAVAARWQGSASFERLDAFCAGVADGLGEHLAQGHPLMLVFDGDVGGLVGLHVREELRLEVPIISIDGIELREFDFIDVGAVIPASGAVPVVIKSLVFPGPSGRCE